MFPDVELQYMFADEDNGYNAGNFIFKAGKCLLGELPEPKSKRIFDICFELKPEQKQFYTFDGETYHVIEGEEEEENG